MRRYDLAFGDAIETKARSPRNSVLIENTFVTFLNRVAVCSRTSSRPLGRHRSTLCSDLLSVAVALRVPASVASVRLLIKHRRHVAAGRGLEGEQGGSWLVAGVRW